MLPSDQSQRTFQAPSSGHREQWGNRGAWPRIYLRCRAGSGNCDPAENLYSQMRKREWQASTRNRLSEPTPRRARR